MQRNFMDGMLKDERTEIYRWLSTYVTPPYIKISDMKFTESANTKH
jgi:ATP-dependent protease HslVU (ClpYQ) ATPase subunit